MIRGLDISNVSPPFFNHYITVYTESNLNLISLSSRTRLGGVVLYFSFSSVH